MRRFLAIAALITALSASACSGDKPAATPPSAKPSPAVFEIDGVLTLQAGQFLSENDSSCHGHGGFDDLDLGAQVTITDAAGAVVALGKLDSMTYNDTNGTGLGGSCDLKFAIPAVPAGRGFYGIEVSHRGAVKYGEAKLKGSPVQLTVG